MKYISIDIETTGLDPKKDQVLEIAAVFEDTEAEVLLPVESLLYKRRIIKHERIEGNPFALSMHQDLLKEIGERTLRDIDFNSPDQVRSRISYAADDISSWVYELAKVKTDGSREQIVLAGKNIEAFDLKFLPESFKKKFHRRVLDAGNIALGSDHSLWWREVIPSLRDLINRDVSHTALEDARDVIRVIRTYTNNYGRGTNE